MPAILLFHATYSLPQNREKFNRISYAIKQKVDVSTFFEVYSVRKYKNNITKIQRNYRKKVEGKSSILQVLKDYHKYFQGLYQNTAAILYLTDGINKEASDVEITETFKGINTRTFAKKLIFETTGAGVAYLKRIRNLAENRVSYFVIDDWQ